VETVEHGGLTWFWLKRCWVRNMRNLTYAKREGVGNFFREWGGFGFRGVYWFGCDIGGMSGIMGWPNMDTNPLLVYCRDF
jgi:hypothetical protein